MENFKIINGKKMSCGIILVDKDNAILAGHPTGKPFDKSCYDIFKGCCDNGENDLDCAKRELSEEAGIILPKDADIIDLGIFKYNKEKNVHLFLYKVDNFDCFNKMVCTSYFTTKNGMILPEMDGYRIIYKNERHLLLNRLERIFINIKQLN